MHPERWEHGSDFHWDSSRWSHDACSESVALWHKEARLYACGRDALRALLEHGQAALGWTRLWMPSYFCEDVVGAAGASGIRVERYADGPWLVTPSLPIRKMSAGDAVLVVDYFAHRGSLKTAVASLPPGVVSIADYTHDPFTPNQNGDGADYAFASLRKTLPIPDGGVLFSSSRPLPECPVSSPDHEVVAQRRLEGMRLKARYLAGENVEKADFRKPFLESEPRFGKGSPAAMSRCGLDILGRLEVEGWRRTRANNRELLRAALQACSDLSVLEASESAEAPQALVLLCESAANRDELRSRLIEAQIYPAVLWPTPDEHPFAEDVSFANRMLVLHCDARYTSEDLMRVAQVCQGGAA